jgi:hypothetical protein
MASVLSTIVLITLYIAYAFCFSCETDADCNNKGACQSDHTCYCEWFYEGESCSERWEDVNKGWIGVWIFYCVYTCILHLSMIIQILRELWATGKFRLNMVTTILLSVLLSCVSKRFPRDASLTVI